VDTLPGAERNIMQYRRCVPFSAIALAFLALSMGPPARAQAPVAGGEPAWGIWTPKELRFVYMGFTSHYSCDGLRDKVRQILLQLGARPDLKVRGVPCSGIAGRPTEFPGVTANMNVLAPFDPSKAAANATPVPAHWKTVVISTDSDPLREAGDCELIEQVKSRVLPLFYARNIDYHSTCIPNQLQVGGTQLKADVLIADPPAPQPAPAAPPPGAPPPR
jgi:hypothetical protein